MVFIYCNLTVGVQRHIIHRASSEMSHFFDRRLNGIVVCSFMLLFDFWALVSILLVGLDCGCHYNIAYPTMKDAIFFIILQDGTYAQSARRLPIICVICAPFLFAKDALKVLITSVLGEAKGSVELV